MSTSDSNIELYNCFVGKPVVMIPLSCVSRLNWDAELGKRLREFRGKRSRRSFSEMLKNMGHNLSHQYLQELEEGKPESISLELLLGICEALGIGISQFVTALKIEQLQ